MSTQNRSKTVGTVLAAVLLAGGATACEDGKKAEGGKAAGTGASAAPSQGAAPKGGAAQATPAAFLEQVRKGSEEITSLRYSMSGQSEGQAMTGEAAMRSKPDLAIRMKMADPATPTEQAEIVVLDGAMYIGSDGKYLKFDLKALGADPNAARKLDSAGGGSKDGENPGDRANELLAAQDLKTVGEETIDGVKTTHVTGTVTLEQMRASLATATPAARERQERQITKLEAQGIKSLAMDMWIDETHHTKQVRTRGTANKGPLDMTIKFLDYNKPVEITAPPADQVVDLAEMMKEGGAGA
ncbi:LppX_LprAFG lipoprotein [Streptomyces sp. NPDC090022]|uniref:LppX_LprAFG lipoprotein n=1 Tax=Streptomyces sp. NPDC090022 TaxID=3365920 RepID=UPI0037FF597A